MNLLESDNSILDVRDLLWKAKQYKFHLLFPVLLTLCGAYIFYKVSVPVYESSVVLNVEGPSSVTPGLDALVRQDRDRGGPREQVSLINGRINSRAFLETLLQRLGIRDRIKNAATGSAKESIPSNVAVTPEEYLMREAMTNVRRRLNVAPIQTNMVRISATAANPVEARDLVTTTTDLLLQQSLQSTLERAEARSVFSEDQIAIYEERLRQSEEALRRYNEALLGRGLQASVINEGNLDVARNLLRINEEEIQQITSRLLSERNAWETEMGANAIPPDISSDAARSMERRLADLEMSLSEASLGGERSLTEAATLRGKIGDLRRTLLQEFEALASQRGIGSESAMSALAGMGLDRALLRSLRTKGNRLESQVRAFTQRVQSSPRDRMELQRLEGNVEANRQMLATLQKEVTSSQISGALATTELGVRLEVLESAQIPLYPIFPNRMKIFGGALLLGPILSLGLVFALEKLGAVVQTPEQAEREYGTRVIGTVPRIEGWGLPGSFLQNHWPALSILVVLALTAVFYTVNTVIKSDAGTKPPSSASPR